MNAAARVFRAVAREMYRAPRCRKMFCARELIMHELNNAPARLFIPFDPPRSLENRRARKEVALVGGWNRPREMPFAFLIPLAR